MDKERGGNKGNIYSDGNNNNIFIEFAKFTYKIYLF